MASKSASRLEIDKLLAHDLRTVPAGSQDGAHRDSNRNSITFCYNCYARTTELTLVCCKRRLSWPERHAIHVGVLRHDADGWQSKLGGSWVEGNRYDYRHNKRGKA